MLQSCTWLNPSSHPIRVLCAQLVLPKPEAGMIVHQLNWRQTSRRKQMLAANARQQPCAYETSRDQSWQVLIACLTCHHLAVSACVCRSSAAEQHLLVGGEMRLDVKPRLAVSAGAEACSSLLRPCISFPEMHSWVRASSWEAAIVCFKKLKRVTDLGCISGRVVLLHKRLHE